MVTLKEIVGMQPLSGMSDMQIIEYFFAENNLEEEGIDLISNLTKSKIAKMKQKYEVAETWITCLPSTYLYENYDLEIADKLHTLELDFLINGCELSKSWMDWAEKNIPNIERPGAYFNPLITYMRKRGIEFKERKDYDLTR